MARSALDRSEGAVLHCTTSGGGARFVCEPVPDIPALTAAFDPSLQRLALASPAATVLAVRLAGLAAIALGLRRCALWARAMRWAGFALMVGSFALIGHTAANSWRWAVAPALIAHVGIASFWFGALPPLYVATVRWPEVAAGSLIEAFSRRALWLVPSSSFGGSGAQAAGDLVSTTAAGASLMRDAGYRAILQSLMTANAPHPC